jgi:GNAT superfamily N-acetyltransferase
MSQSQIQIRRAVNSDVPALRSLQERSMRLLGRGHYTVTQIEAFIARIGTMDDYLVGDRTYLVAELDGELLGCGGWTARLPGYARHIHGETQSAEPERATVRSVFVEPLAARQGIGRRIMGAIENAMRDEGFRIAELGSTDNGRDFYRSLGYLPVAGFQVDVGDGIHLRLTRMRKSLVPANSDEANPSLMSA